MSDDRSSNDENVREVGEALELRKLRAEAVKAEIELAELARPYLKRICYNPQNFSTVIAMIDAFVGAYILIKNNTYQALNATAQLAEQHARTVEEESRKRIEAANATAEEAEMRSRAAKRATDLAEQQITAAQTQLQLLQSQKARLSSQNNDLLIKSDLLPFQSLFRKPGPYFEQVITAMTAIPARRRALTLHRLFESRGTFFPAQSSSREDELDRDACLSAMLLAASGDSDWLMHLQKYSSEYLRVTQSPRGTIGGCYHELPRRYDTLRRTFLLQVLARFEVIPCNEKEIMKSTVLDSCYLEPSNGSRLTACDVRSEAWPFRSTKLVDNWLNWRTLATSVFIPERDIDFLSDRALIDFAVSYRPLVGGVVVTAHLQSLDGRSSASLIGRTARTPTFFNEMYTLAVLRMNALGETDGKLTSPMRTFFVQDGEFKLDPIGRAFKKY